MCQVQVVEIDGAPKLLPIIFWCADAHCIDETEPPLSKCLLILFICFEETYNKISMVK